MSSSCCFYLTRHGATDYTSQGRLQGKLDIPLNALGRSQAKDAAEYLREVPITALYTSNLSRDQETGAIIAAGRGLMLEIEPELDEISHGDWEGRTPEEIDTWQYHLWKHQPTACRKPEGETLTDFSSRVIPAWEALIERHRGRNSNVVVVSHQITIQVILCHLAKLDLDHLWTFKQEHCCTFNIISDHNGIATLRDSIVPWKLLSVAA